MRIVVMGSCRKCKMAYETIERVIAQTGSDARLEKIEDIQQMLAAGVRTMPVVVVDDTVVLKGRVPSEQEVRDMIGLNRVNF